MEFSVMHTAKRAIRRSALIGWLGLLGLTGLPAHLAQAAAPPERILPDTTIFLFKLNDVKSFRESFRNSQYGQLWNDPSLKDFRDELALKLEDATKALKERIGVSLKELFELPQGALAVAAIGRDDPNLPVAGAILADTGENEKKMLDILGRTTKQAEDAGAKISTESFNGLTLHVVQFPREGARERERREGQRQRESDAGSAPGLDQCRKPVLHRQRRRRHQGPGRPSRGPRQFARRDRAFCQDPGEDRVEPSPGDLVSRCQQARQSW